MKLIFGMLFLLGGSSLFAQSASSIVVANATSLQRSDELVLLKRTFLQKKLKQLTTKDYVLVKHGNQPIVVQYDDLNGDGIWDEAVFLYTFKPKESVRFAITVSNMPAAIKAVVKAHVRQKHKLADNSFGETVLADTMPYNNAPTDFSKQKLPPYLTEGPAWENDKVGFRKYFDMRNANDTWGKTTGKMVMDEVGVNPDSIYHNRSWWGMDILKVGKSLGAGAIALHIPLKEKGRDTLLRMGSNAKHIVYRSIADGPVRAIFSISYEDCTVATNLQPITVVETISIWGGQYFYNNEVMIKNAPKGTRLGTGIPDFYHCNMDSIKTKASVALYSFGKQSEYGDTLSMAILVPAKNFDRISKAAEEHSDIKDAFLISQRVANNEPVRYRFYSLWQLTNNVFSDKKNVHSFLGEQTALMQSPLVIK
ncbi:MAG TPA: DUF4861 family protein [Phnomibacter sp.]|nr:DUF4861 family protein [Phnomibacter sp.]